MLNIAESDEDDDNDDHDDDDDDWEDFFDFLINVGEGNGSCCTMFPLPLMS